MTVLVVGKFYSEGFAQHIAETLEAMGHDIVQYEVGLKVQQSGSVIHHRVKQAKQLIYEFYSKTSIHDQISNRKLSHLLVSNKIDLTICCHDFLRPAEVTFIRRTTASPVVLWFPDAISNFGKAMFLDADYDMLFFKEPFIVNVLRKDLGKKAFYLPECCNPVYHKKVTLTEADKLNFGCDITTAGNMHSARSALFKLLSSYKVRIWGNPPPRWMEISNLREMIQGTYVSNEEKAKAFLAAKIVVNNLHPTEIFGVNVRLFEIAGCGAFQLTSWRPAIKQLYKEEEEIICYHSIDDLYNKIERYLNDVAARNQIAENAYCRTLKDHTYKHRLSLLLDTVENKAQGYTLLESYL